MPRALLALEAADAAGQVAQAPVNHRVMLVGDAVALDRLPDVRRVATLGAVHHAVVNLPRLVGTLVEEPPVVGHHQQRALGSGPTSPPRCLESTISHEAGAPATRDDSHPAAGAPIAGRSITVNDPKYIPMTHWYR